MKRLPTARPARDVRLIIAARGVRSFAYGMVAVVLGVALSIAGFSATAIGVLITVSLAGDFCGTYLIGLVADRWGRRRTLVFLAFLMALTGGVFGFVRVYPILLLAAFFGTLGTSASETAPFLPIEQAIIPQLIPPAERISVFARYNLVAAFAGAVGAVVVGLPDALTHVGLPLSSGIQLLFGVYVGAACVSAALAIRLSSRVEAPEPARDAPLHDPKSPPAGTSATSLWQRLIPPLGESRRLIVRLAALFTVDALAGGLTVQSLLALYLHLRFGVSLGQLAIVFFASNTLSALSFLAAVPLARRVGLLNTMVWTHLPSNVVLALVALMPLFPLAVGMLLARQALSQMDVPTRQAYTMALVTPEEQTAAASVTSLARSAGAATGPVLAGLLLQGPLLMLGVPLLVAGLGKAGYDLPLWRVFRRVSLPSGARQ